ncbi:hypothetical protein [Tsukamurella pseudospumae]|uniref:Uncharacterized protein n=1 Tax=Tsukamurella pseudospumae TaxID=239498 RepID=A0A137YT20_9ACTN|nr:hypothetical protein [Tsukamurella pseudospumae]KXO89140.1 hypothetical protein AXK61_11030 [Tsukamurella pseudospumae]
MNKATGDRGGASAVEVQDRSGETSPHPKILSVTKAADGGYRLRLSNGRTMIARKDESGRYVAVKNVGEAPRQKRKRVARLTPAPRKRAPAAADAYLEELDAILRMENTGRSRRGVR